MTFTRTRAGKKNDNGCVEQKNWSLVRRMVGYGRLETDRELQLPNQLYDVARLYRHCFQPWCKLRSKQRNGVKVTKRYDQAQTAYHRVLASDQVDEEAKARLRQTFDQLHPAALKRQLRSLQAKLDAARTESGLPTKSKAAAVQEGLGTLP